MRQRSKTALRLCGVWEAAIFLCLRTSAAEWLHYTPTLRDLLAKWHKARSRRLWKGRNTGGLEHGIYMRSFSSRFTSGRPRRKSSWDFWSLDMRSIKMLPRKSGVSPAAKSRSTMAIRLSPARWALLTSRNFPHKTFLRQDLQSPLHCSWEVNDSLRQRCSLHLRAILTFGSWCLSLTIRQRHSCERLTGCCSPWDCWPSFWGALLYFSSRKPLCGRFPVWSQGLELWSAATLPTRSMCVEETRLPSWRARLTAC